MPLGTFAVVFESWAVDERAIISTTTGVPPVRTEDFNRRTQVLRGTRNTRLLPHKKTQGSKKLGSTSDDFPASGEDSAVETVNRGAWACRRLRPPHVRVTKISSPTTLTSERSNG